MTFSRILLEEYIYHPRSVLTWIRHRVSPSKCSFWPVWSSLPRGFHSSVVKQDIYDVIHQMRKDYRAPRGFRSSVVSRSLRVRASLSIISLSQLSILRTNPSAGDSHLHQFTQFAYIVFAIFSSLDSECRAKKLVAF